MYNIRTVQRGKALVLFFAILLQPISIQAQRRAIPDNNLSYPVLIQLATGAGRIGTGFYLNDKVHLYLVTARHVLFQPPEHKLKSETATLLSYPSDINEDAQYILTVNLQKLLEAGQIKYHATHDVAVVQIARNKTLSDGKNILEFNDWVTVKHKSKSGIVTVAISKTKKYDEVLTGNEVYIFGYPVALGIKKLPQLDYSRPLLRRGIVAGKNKKLKTIILDCPVYGGNSGGPILEVDQVKFNKWNFRVIGVISQFVPFAEAMVNKTLNYQNIRISNSGYSVGVPMDMVFELIAKQQQQK